MMNMMMKISSPMKTLNRIARMKIILMMMKYCNYINHISIIFNEVYLLFFIFNSEDGIERVWDMLNLMEYDLSYCSQLKLSERSIMVANIWTEIIMQFREWNLEQTVGLLLFRGSNYIEYVDCDIEDDDGVILKAKSVVSTNNNISLILF